MNKAEFATFAVALKTYYPKEKLLPNDKAMELWFYQLNDIPYKVAEVMLNRWAATNKWSPSIADIREQAAELMQGEAKEWGEAWQEVLKAIRFFGTYKEEEALKSLDETTRAVVKRLGYRNLCFSEKLEVDRANFRMIYEQKAARDKQDAQLPQKLKELIGKMPLMLEEGASN